MGAVNCLADAFGMAVLIFDGHGLMVLFLVLVVLLLLFLVVATEILFALTRRAEAGTLSAGADDTSLGAATWVLWIALGFAVAGAITLVALWIAYELGSTVTLPLTLPSLNGPFTTVFTQGLGIVGLALALLGGLYAAFAAGQLRDLTSRVTQAVIIGLACALVLASAALIIGQHSCAIVTCWVDETKTPRGYVPWLAFYGLLYGVSQAFTTSLPAAKPPLFSVRASAVAFLFSGVFTSATNYWFVDFGQLDLAIQLALMTALIFGITSLFSPFIGWHVYTMPRANAARISLALTAIGAALVLLQYVLT